MQEGALIRGGFMWSLMDLNALGFLSLLIDFVVLQVEVPFGLNSATIQNLIPEEY